MIGSSACALTIITDRADSLRAFELLRQSFALGAKVFREHLVGWQGGSERFDIYCHPSLEIWGVLELAPPSEKRPGRFWNCFGISDPLQHPMLAITVEINPPHEGENRRVGGLFLRDDRGRVFLAHSGKVGGGRKGISQQAFRAFYRAGDWQEIGKHRVATIVGPVDRADLPRALADFVHTVARFKEEAVSRPRR